MAKARTIKWVKSTTPDVVAYKVYVDKGSVNYNSPCVVLPATAESYALPGAFWQLWRQEAIDWYVMVSAVDENGNGGDRVLGPIELDFLAPQPVSDLRVE